MGLRLDYMKRAPVLLARNFGARNKWVRVFNLACQPFLVITVDQADAKAAVKLHSFLLCLVNQDNVIAPKVDINRLRL